MSHEKPESTPRREFLERLGVMAVGISAPHYVSSAVDPNELRNAQRSPATSPWDMSWVDRVTAAKYRVVIDASNIADGYALDVVSDFMDLYHEVYGTRDDETRAVVVMRQLGTPMAFKDELWDRYAIGEERNIKDPATKAPARRNPFLRAPAGASVEAASSKVETLQKRGLTVLVCNRAAMNWAHSFAEKSKRDVEAVRAEVRNGLISGALLMPSGLFALIRAQNAGCAFMRGT